MFIRSTIKALSLSATLAALLSGAAAAETVRIGIANFGEHPQLSDAVQGFKDALAEDGFAEGDQVTYSESHVNFDPSLVPQMVAKLQAENPALIYAVTTPVAQIAKNALSRTDIPVVFAAVTDPVAAKLVPSWEAGDKGMTGASDLQDVDAILTFTRKLLPDAKRLGVPYNPGEANDVALLDKVSAAAAAHGFEVAGVGIDNPNDIQQRVASLAGKVDVIYAPASNLVQPAISAVAASARQAGIPMVNADDGAVREGIVPASIAVNYRQVGANAGHIAARILKGEDPASIAPDQPAATDHMTVISRQSAKDFGLTIPDSLADCDCLID